MTNLDNNSLREMAAAFVGGTLTQEEMAAVERRMASDEALRREVEAVRRTVAAAQDWLDAEAPGAARADALAAPPLKAAVDIAAAYRSPIEVRRTVPSHRRFAPVFQFAAAAAIFVAGFWLGIRTSGEADQTPITASQDLSTEQQAGPVVTPAPLDPDAPAAPSPTPAPQRDTPPAVRAVAQGPTYKTDEQGRLIIETTLGSEMPTPVSTPRSRAIVVVDGGFRLNN